MGFKDLFNNDYETSDNNRIESLKTRYYQNRYEEVLEVIKKMVEDEQGITKTLNEKYQELFFETSSYSCTVTLYSVRPSETAVDFKITTYKLIPNGKGKKIIERLYNYLDKRLYFKGVSLFK